MIKLAVSSSEKGLKMLIARFYYSNPENFVLSNDGKIYNTKLRQTMRTSWSKTKHQFILWGE